MKTALVIGATGLVGSQLVLQLLADERVAKVITFGRGKTGRPDAKLEEHVIDFEAPASWSPLVHGDVAFSALGTTIKQAGSQAAQKKVDHDYQLAFAQAAASHGVPCYVLCSAASADPTSSRFYSRIKGELDRAVQQLGFPRVRIMRPSLLGGERRQARTGEKVGSVMLRAFNAVGLARKYREIPGATVAAAMLNAAFDPAPGTRIFTLDEIFVEAARLNRL